MHARAVAPRVESPNAERDAPPDPKRSLRALDGFDAQEAALRPSASTPIDPSNINVIKNEPRVEITAGGTGFGSCVPKVELALDEGVPPSTPTGWKPAGALSVSITVNLHKRADRTDVSSADSGALKPENWALAQQDLTPNVGGFAPRTKFYASHLSARHEHVHADDYRATASAAIDKRFALLRKMKVSDAAAARAHTKTFLEAVEGDLIESYAGPGKRAPADCLDATDMESYMARPGEAHAFSDGKPAYEALAAGIGKRFAKGRSR